MPAPATTPPPSIAELTRRMAAGDEAAYRRFHDLYVDRLVRYLLVVAGGDEQAMREALQGALHRVVRHVRVFEDEAVFWSWLTVLARSAHADERRKRRRYRTFLERFARHAEFAAVTPDAEQAEARLGEALAAGLAALPADERALLQAKYTERQPVRAMAEQLGTTEKAVESRLTRARLKLKALVLEGLRHE